MPKPRLLKSNTRSFLKQDLVLLETTPGVIAGSPLDQIDVPPPHMPPQTYSPALYFKLSLQRLGKNYHSLFRHFSLLNLWLSFYDQVMIIFPYVVAAPLLFADSESDRITLGVLIKLSNSFDKVFSSMSVISENWSAVNEFRSVVVRLREFESKLYEQRHTHTSTSSNDGATSSTTRNTRPRSLISAFLLPPPVTPVLASDDPSHYPDELSNVQRRSRDRDGQELTVVNGASVKISTTYGDEYDMSV